MPRPKGSLNKATLAALVESGQICLLANRLSCVKCREAREAAQPRPPAPSLFGPGAEAAPAAARAPVQAMLVDTFVEYNAPDGREWRIERGVDMLMDFAIERTHLRQYIGLWHSAMAGQERVWLIVRRIYGVAPMLGTSDPDDLRAWSPEELGTQLGLSAEQVTATIGETRAFWQRYRAANPVEKKGVKIDTKAPMTAAEITDILTLYNFETITGDNERRYAAKRCRDLAPYLENEQGMPIARSAIQQELNIMVLDSRIGFVQDELKQRKAENAKALISAADDKRVTDLMEARGKANKTYEETMKAMGATQVQTGQVAKRLSFQMSVGTMMEAIQRYKADAEHELIDNFATFAEVELVVREKELRPSQYRPDVVVAFHEAMEHLWEKNWEPTPIGRQRVRRLRKAFNTAIRESLSEDGETVPDAIEEEMLGDSQGPALPSALPAGMSEEAGPAGALPVAMPRGRNADDEVAVF